MICLLNNNPRPLGRINKSILLIVRVLKDGNLGNSQPCNDCCNLISKYATSLKKIIYSMDNEHFVCIKPKELHILNKPRVACSSLKYTNCQLF